MTYSLPRAYAVFSGRFIIGHRPVIVKEAVIGSKVGGSSAQYF